jgi:hypothetical protein
LLPALSDGGSKFLVTSFECFGACRFATAANAVHTARKISYAKAASNLRPAYADDSKPSGHMIEHLVDGLADHMRFAAASHAGGAIGCGVRKEAADIRIGFRC